MCVQIYLAFPWLQQQIVNLLYPGTPRKRRTLMKTAVPSQFTWVQEPSPSTKRRMERGKLRLITDSTTSTETAGLGDHFISNLDVQEEVIVTDSASNVVDEPVTECSTAAADDVSQTPHWSRMSIEDLATDEKAMHIYTGLESYRHFQYVMESLGPAAYDLKYRWRKPQKISVENQLLMTLIKLRIHTPNPELAYLFNVSEYTVANIFVTWVNFMYCSWIKLDIWPSRELVDSYIPADFTRLYPSTRVVVDGMEVPIKKPGKPTAQQVTYSTYKNRNTLKAIIGITPGGLTSYVSPAYGGSASDRIIVERENLAAKFDAGDSVMADKGFNVQDIFAPHNVAINTPTFLRKKNQLSTTEIVHDRKIARKRVHVERVIGLAKTYKILTSPMNEVETILGSRIIFVCFMLCNHRSCIIPTRAWTLLACFNLLNMCWQ